MISFIEYLERIPKGLIPNVTGLINTRRQQEVAEQQAAMQQQAVAEPSAAPVSTDEIGDEEVLEYIRQNRPDVYEQLMRLSPEDQQKAMSLMRSGAATQTNTQEVGDM